MALGEIAQHHAVERVELSGRGPRWNLPFYLALKEVWRNKGRFALIAGVVALITVLVLFIAALAEGLGAGNKEYIEKLDAQLIVYQANVDISIPSSAIGQSKLRTIRRVQGVKAAGPIAFSNGTLVFTDGAEPLKISLIGVEPGQPGEPPVVDGRGLVDKNDKEAIVDRNVALRAGVVVGDRLTLKTTQNTDEQFNELIVVGITDSRQYSIQPSVVVPYRTWDEVRPKVTSGGEADEVVFNVVGVQLDDPTQIDSVAARLAQEVRNVEAVDRKTAYESTPGYTAQQSTLSTQRAFSLLIGVLVVGGFFQIQALQRVAQVGMLKAIGASNTTIVTAFIFQIVVVTSVGVAAGALGTFVLSLGLPPVIPLIFTRESVASAVSSLLLIGPIGGLVSIRALLKVEPLTALGLAA